MSSNYSEIATKLNSSADTIESITTTISNKKTSFDSIWSGSAHDNLIGNLDTSVKNVKTQISNIRKMAGSLNNLQSYKNKKEARDNLQSQLNGIPETEENKSTISKIKSDIDSLDKELDTLKNRINVALSGFSRVSKNFSIIDFDITEEKEEPKEVDSEQTKQTSSMQTMVKSSDSYPDFSNLDAWVYKNPYAQAGYTGQCTWFSWGKFYETYGYSPGFTSHGYRCVSQLLRAHGDKFYESDTPVAGSVFSVLPNDHNPYGHTGMITAVNGDIITVQDGNYNGKSDSFEVAQKDWGTFQISLADFKVKYRSKVVFANPI